MNKPTNRRATRIRRHVRLRTNLEGGATRPRLAIFRSLHHVYAQIIDDASGRTLAAASTTDADLRKALKSLERGRRRGGWKVDRRACPEVGHRDGGLRSRRFSLSRPGQSAGRGGAWRGIEVLSEK